MKCLCGEEMKISEAGLWDHLYTCPKCLTTVAIFFSDLMSGAMIRYSYEWRTSKGEFIISYDETRKGKRINIKEEKT